MNKIYDSVMKGHEIEADKARHYVVGTAISLAIVVINYLLGELDAKSEIIASVAIVLVIAVWWELWQMAVRDMRDRKYLKEAAKDVLATTLGSIPVAIALLTKI